MSTGQLIGAVVGGIIGTIISPGYGTLVGLSLGYTVGGYIDPIRPDVQTPGAPKTLGLQIMPNEIGNPIPDCLGTAKAVGELLVFGGEHTDPVYSAMEAGGGGKGGGGDGGDTEYYVSGWRYYMTWAVGIVMGPVDTLYTVFADEKIVWEGTLNRPISGGQETIVLTDMGAMIFYFGTDDQVANSTVGVYTAPTLNTPWRGLCWAFMSNCFIGDYNRCPTMTFVFRKSPAISFSPRHAIQTYDYNPAHAIWYVLVELAGLPVTWLNEDDFADFADKLFFESRGLSILFQGQQSALRFLETIIQHVDAILRFGSDGKFHPKLLRYDYDPDTLPVVDKTFLVEEPTFSRKSWIETQNEIKVEYSEITAPRPLHYAYFGHVDSKVTRLDLNDFQTITTLNLEADETQLYGIGVDLIRRRLIFGSNPSSKIIFIDLDNFIRIGAITLDFYVLTIIVDQVAGVVYVPGSGYPWPVAKIDIATMTEIGRLWIYESYPGVFNSTQDDSYIYLCASGMSSPTHRIRKSDFTYQGNIYLSGNHGDSYGIDLVEADKSKIYFGQITGYVNYSLIARIDPASFTFDGSIQCAAGEDIVDCQNNPIMDKVNRKIYVLGWLLDSTVPRIIKFDLASMTREGDLFYDVAEYPTMYTGIFDPSRDCMYYGGYSKIMKVTTSPFAITNSVVQSNLTIVSAAIA